MFLVCHHDDWDIETPLEVNIQLAGLSDDRNYHVSKWEISRGRANAHTAWELLGRPQRPGEQELKEMTRAARLRAEPAGQTVAGAGGEQITVVIAPHSVCLFIFET